MSKHAWAYFDWAEYPGTIGWCTRCGVLRQDIREGDRKSAPEFAVPDSRLEPRDPKSAVPVWRNDAPPCRP